MKMYVFLDIRTFNARRNENPDFNSSAELIEARINAL
jgi:hypothetical protein